MARRCLVASMNRVLLMGNLTRDPEVRQVSSGAAVADLGLAVSERYKNRSGEHVETKCFIDIVVWGRQAEVCGQYLRKGSPLLIEGRLQLDQWEKDSQKRSKLRVRADRIEFIGTREGASAARPRIAGSPDEEDETPF